MSETTTTENSILLSNGEINPSAYAKDPIEKLKNLRTLFPPEKYNIVMFSQFLMNSLPEGISLKPQFVTVSDDDLWDEKNASGVKLTAGHVMLKSEKVINIAQAIGLRLEKVLEEETILNKIPHLRIEYVASLRLPDGTIVKSSPVGKSLPITTKDGSNQAHIYENVDRKAKRNAIKEMLAIPTQMKREEAQKMWVCVRAVVGDGSTESQEVGKTIEASATVATENLYGDPTPTVLKPYTAQEFQSWIKECNTQARWDELRDSLSRDIIEEELTFLGLKTLLANKYRELNPKEQKL
ncbi:hypothetical protein EHQ43_10025 [Leptospira bouyouniensis]|uniref:Uncharacterized protein n=1 Tax=Leptospira bouyouniensis TaxID=2484911 RepID=A0A7I0HRL3_9LEPT|nr:hypothetical protein [Leptospira bouyouniensis]TGL04972.1 hypothetical protein EHQ43_10025 [Leptospira bouyouniensis]